MGGRRRLINLNRALPEQPESDSMGTLLQRAGCQNQLPGPGQLSSRQVHFNHNSRPQPLRASLQPDVISHDAGTARVFSAILPVLNSHQEVIIARIAKTEAKLETLVSQVNDARNDLMSACAAFRDIFNQMKETRDAPQYDFCDRTSPVFPCTEPTNAKQRLFQQSVEEKLGTLENPMGAIHSNQSLSSRLESIQSAVEQLLERTKTSDATSIQARDVTPSSPIYLDACVGHNQSTVVEIGASLTSRMSEGFPVASSTIPSPATFHSTGKSPNKLAYVDIDVGQTPKATRTFRDFGASPRKPQSAVMVNEIVNDVEMSQTGVTIPVQRIPQGWSCASITRHFSPALRKDDENATEISKERTPTNPNLSGGDESDHNLGFDIQRDLRQSCSDSDTDSLEPCHGDRLDTFRSGHMAGFQAVQTTVSGNDFLHYMGVSTSQMSMHEKDASQVPVPSSCTGELIQSSRIKRSYNLESKSLNDEFFFAQSMEAEGSMAIVEEGLSSRQPEPHIVSGSPEDKESSPHFDYSNRLSHREPTVELVDEKSLTTPIHPEDDLPLPLSTPQSLSLSKVISPETVLNASSPLILSSVDDRVIADSPDTAVISPIRSSKIKEVPPCVSDLSVDEFSSSKSLAIDIHTSSIDNITPLHLTPLSELSSLDASDADSETCVVPAKWRHKKANEKDLTSGVQAAQRKKLVIKTVNQSTAATRIKRKSRKSDWDLEPPLKRAREKAESRRAEDKIPWTRGRFRSNSTSGKSTASPAKEGRFKKQILFGCEWPEKAAAGGDIGFKKAFIECTLCKEWYHYDCVGIAPEDPRLEPDVLFVCPPCHGGASPLATTNGNSRCGRPDCDWICDSVVDEFFVVGILGRASVVRNNERTIHWLLRWQGYPVSASTWEPKESMNDAESMIKEFNEKARKENIPNLDNLRTTILLQEAVKAGITPPGDSG